MSMIAANTAQQHLMKNPKMKFLSVMEFNSLRFWFEIHTLYSWHENNYYRSNLIPISPKFASIMRVRQRNCRHSVSDFVLVTVIKRTVSDRYTLFYKSIYWFWLTYALTANSQFFFWWLEVPYVWSKRKPYNFSQKWGQNWDFTLSPDELSAGAQYLILNNLEKTWKLLFWTIDHSHASFNRIVARWNQLHFKVQSDSWNMRTVLTYYFRTGWQTVDTCW